MKNLEVVVKENEKNPAPIALQIDSSKNPAAELKIHLGKHSSAEIHLSFLGDLALTVNTTLQEGASLKFLQIQDQATEKNIQHKIVQEKNTALDFLDLSLSGVKREQSLEVFLKSELAVCSLRGIYLGRASEKMDWKIAIYHEAPFCKSEQFFRGALNDQARAKFVGKVVVAAHAEKTEAHQKNDTILLCQGPEVSSSPELEIYHDDVVCSHGATVGELSEEALFYLMARGIDQAQARKMLLSGFLKEVLQGFSEIASPLLDQYL